MFRNTLLLAPAIVALALSSTQPAVVNLRHKPQINTSSSDVLVLSDPVDLGEEVRDHLDVCVLLFQSWQHRPEPVVERVIVLAQDVRTGELDFSGALRLEGEGQVDNSPFENAYGTQHQIKVKFEARPQNPANNDPAHARRSLPMSTSAKAPVVRGHEGAIAGRPDYIPVNLMAFPVGRGEVISRTFVYLRLRGHGAVTAPADPLPFTLRHGHLTPEDIDRRDHVGASPAPFGKWFHLGGLVVQRGQVFAFTLPHQPKQGTEPEKEREVGWDEGEAPWLRADRVAVNLLDVHDPSVPLAPTLVIHQDEFQYHKDEWDPDHVAPWINFTCESAVQDTDQRDGGESERKLMFVVTTIAGDRVTHNAVLEFKLVPPAEPTS